MIGRRFGEALMSAVALAILLTALVAVDDRVRERAALWVGGTPPSAELAGIGHQVRDLTAVVMDAARDQSLEHAPLLIFVLAATVLVLFMLRT